MKKFLTVFAVVFTLAVAAQTTLPTSWSFPTTSFPNGWSASGISYYTGSGNTPPAAKLDSDNDYVEIWFASAPGSLSYYLMGNSFSGGQFDVLESPNGTAWTTLHSYTTNMPTSNYTQFTDN